MTSAAAPCNSTTEIWYFFLKETTEIWYGTVVVQLGSYHPNLDRKQQSSQFLLSGSESSVILKISKPLKESGLLATSSSHLRPWRYPMCLSLSASFSTTWERWNEYRMQELYFILDKIYNNREHLHLTRHKLSLWFQQSQQLASDQKSIRRQAWLLSTAGGPPYMVDHQVLAEI